MKASMMALTKVAMKAGYLVQKTGATMVEMLAGLTVETSDAKQDEKLDAM